MVRYITSTGNVLTQLPISQKMHCSHTARLHIVLSSSTHMNILAHNRLNSSESKVP